MQPVAHVLEYYQTKLAWADAADWPHVHLREQVRHYQILNAFERADITELGIARAKKAAQADLEQMLDNNHHLKQSLHNYVLQAIDDFASNELGEHRGWKDKDLPNLFKALDAHLDTLIKRRGATP